MQSSDERSPRSESSHRLQDTGTYSVGSNGHPVPRPLPLDAPERLTALDHTGLMDSPEEEAFDRFTRMAARAVGAPVALVSLVDDKRQFFKSAVGLKGPLATERQTPLSHSYCRYVVASGKPFVVPDARTHPVVRDNPAIDDYDAISYCGVPLIDAEGHVLGTLCATGDRPREWGHDEVAALQDIVKSVAAEVQLRLLSAELTSANATLQEFVAIASHDLRGPLSIILGFAGFLAEPDISEEERIEFAQAILGAGDRAHTLVTDLLDISKLKSETVEPRLEVIELSTAISEVVAVEPSVAANVNIPEGVAVVVDSHHLQRIICNLVRNAINHGQPPISIRARSQRDRVEIQVCDSGEGVPEALAPSLFEMFSRADRSRSDGSGLGLAIVAGLVKANGGSVRYQRNEPTGAKFTVDLPAASSVETTDSGSGTAS